MQDLNKPVVVEEGRGLFESAQTRPQIALWWSLGHKRRGFGLIGGRSHRIGLFGYIKNVDAKRTKGMYRKRIQKAWGHTAHRGWARLLLDRARDLIIHGPAHRGANGAAMPMDEDDQDGHFFYNHPERGVYFAA